MLTTGKGCWCKWKFMGLLITWKGYHHHNRNLSSLFFLCKINYCVAYFIFYKYTIKKVLKKGEKTPDWCSFSEGDIISMQSAKLLHQWSLYNFYNWEYKLFLFKQGVCFNSLVSNSCTNLSKPWWDGVE